MYINELMAHKEQEQLNGTNDQSPMKADIMSTSKIYSHIIDRNLTERYRLTH